jgi:hypothetical protein
VTEKASGPNELGEDAPTRTLPVASASRSGSDALPPPPPPPESSSSHRAGTGAVIGANYAAAAAMAKDILSVDPKEDRAQVAEELNEDERSEPDAEPVALSDGNPPLAQDFFTSPRPKKRLWRSK